MKLQIANRIIVTRMCVFVHAEQLHMHIAHTKYIVLVALAYSF